MQEAPAAEDDGGDGGPGEGEEAEGVYDGNYDDYEGYDEGEEAAEIDFSLPFPAEIPLEPATRALSKIPVALFYPLALAAAAAAGAAGMAAGRGAPVSPQHRDAVALTTAAVGAGAVLFGAAQAKKTRDRVATVDLFNTLVYVDDPSTLTRDDVTAVGAKHGVDMRRDQLDGLVQIFGQYLEGVVPKGDQPLRGDEAARIMAFKDALGLTDEEVAPAFIEVGRRLSRAGWEIKDRQAQFEQRKAFQRLVYLSYAALGDQQAALLLPWRKEFNLNDSQVFVARRDNARAAFGQRLAERYGGDLPADVEALKELREFQAGVKLLDDVAEDSVREAARSHVERQLAAAAQELRAPLKTRDGARAVEAVQSVLDYSRKLQSLASEEGVVPGLSAPPSLAGGEWAAAGGPRRRDVKDLYRLYSDARVTKEGAFTPAIEADLKDLAAILCLTPKEASDLRSEVAAGLYRRLLKEEVSSRRIDAAASPAAVLGTLVSKSGISPEAALQLHKVLYRQKLDSLVASKKLSSEDSAELQRIRRVLCIPQDAANEIMRLTSGQALSETLDQVLGTVPRPLTEPELKKVDDVVSALKVERDVAKAVFAEAARKRLKAFAGQAVKELQQNDRKAAAVQLKRMVQFNSLVVTPLLDRVAGTEAAKKELADLMAKAAEDAKKEEAQEAAKKLEEAIKKAKEASSSKAAGGEGGAKPEAPADKPAAAAEAAPPADVEAKPEAVEATVAEPGAEASSSAQPSSAVIDVAAEAPAAGAAAEEDAAAKAAAEARLKAEEEEERRLKAEAERKAKEDADPLTVVRKAIAASRGEFGEEEKRAQKEITLANDIDKAIRGDLYKVYLMFSMSGDVVELPVGGVVRKKHGANENRTQEMARLQQLSDVLGMGPPEVAAVHSELSEQAFKQQAQEVMRGPGARSPQVKSYLEDMRKQLQLPEDKANKIIREIRTEVMGASAALEEEGGQKWTVERVLEAHKEGVDVKKALEEPARRVLLRREIDRRLGDGKAEFDAKLLLDELPKILGVEQKRVSALLRELVGTRKRMLLVQAVSQHRQKRMSDAVTSLANLISAYRAQPEAGGVGVVQWGEREELKGLLGTFCSKVDDAAKRAELAGLFGLSDSDLAEAASASGAAGGGGVQQQVDEGQRDEVDLFF